MFLFVPSTSKRNLLKEITRVLKPVPSIYPSNVYKDKPSCSPSLPLTRKPPAQRYSQEDESNLFENEFKINTFNDVDERLLAFLDDDYHITKYPDHVVFYKHR